MSRRRIAEDLSVEELRKLLIEKKRLERQDRLEKFRETGRLVPFVSQPPAMARKAPSVEPRERRSRRLFDRFLFVVEVVAVLGLLAVLVMGISLLRDLNHEVAAVLRQPSPTPTSQFFDVVLPDGHTSPSGPGGARPNEAEVPEHLRPTMQSLAAAPLPTPSPEQAKRIQIPAIQVDAPIVQGDSWDQLKNGVGQHIGTGSPGQKGNLVLSGHDDVYGEVFRDLPMLKEGDAIIISTDQHQYTYLVTGSQIVAPDRVDVMQATETARVTLISCFPYLIDTQRIVVTAELQNNS